MIFIKKNGQIVRADGKDLREVVSLQKADFPETGEVGILYVATNENKVYRWDETEEDYIPVGSNGETYTAGNGIVITDNEISIDGEVVAKKEDLEDYRTASEQDVIDVQKENTSNKISSLTDATDNVKYLGAKVVKDELQNVREVAEGKCKSIATSYTYTDSIAEIKEYVEGHSSSKVLLYTKEHPEGEDVTDALKNGDYNDWTNKTGDLNSQADRIPGPFGGYNIRQFILIKSGIAWFNFHLYLLGSAGDKNSYFNIGDTIYVFETNVPDRWALREDIFGLAFRVLETSKVDLTNYYNKGEVNDLLDDKADVGDNYTKQETDDLLDDKANSSDVYSKTDADDTFATKTELGNKQDKSTVRTITTQTFNGGLSSNELTEFTQPMTSLTIASLAVATGDNVPVWKAQFVAGSGFSFTSIPTIVWKYGTPTSWEANKEYHLVIKKSLEANTYIVEREEDVVDVNSAQTITGVKTFSGGTKYGTWEIKENSSGNIEFIKNGAAILTLRNNILYPDVANQFSIGTPTQKIKDFYLSGKITDGTNEITPAGLSGFITADEPVSTTLTNEEYALYTSGKLIITENGIYFPTKLNGSGTQYSGTNLNFSVTAGGTVQNFRPYTINVSNKVISYPYTRIQINQAAGYISLPDNVSIKGKTFPNYSKGYFYYDGSNLIWKEIMEITAEERAKLGRALVEPVKDTTSTSYSGGISSNKEYSFTQPLTALNITTLNITTDDNLPIWSIVFTAGTGISVSLPDGVKWANGTTPTFTQGKIYKIMISQYGSNYLAVAGEF